MYSIYMETGVFHPTGGMIEKPKMPACSGPEPAEVLRARSR